MTLVLHDDLTTALLWTFTAPTKARRATEARKAAELLRAGEPISDDARRCLAAGLDGTLKPPRHRTVDLGDVARRALACMDYRWLREANPTMTKDEALELIAERYHVPDGTLREWVYPHRKRKK